MATFPGERNAAPANLPPADLLLGTRVERIRQATPGGTSALYRCDLPSDWNAAYYPFGGAVSAVALRAIESELDNPAQRPRTMTTVFSSPIQDGALEIEVETLRAGRGMSQLLATVRGAGDGGAGHTTLAVLGGAREGFEFTDIEPPDAPPPEDCDPPKAPPPGHPMHLARFFQQIDVRQWNLRASWETDWVGERAEAMRWMRFRVPPRRADGTLDPAAYVALCDTMPPAVGQKLGAGQPSFMAPSCDLTVHFLAATREEWLLVQTRCHWAGEGYGSCSVHLWDRGFRLVAHATQLMYFRVDPTDPTDPS